MSLYESKVFELIHNIGDTDELCRLPIHEFHDVVALYPDGGHIGGHRNEGNLFMQQCP